VIGRLLLACLVGLLAACRTHPSGLPLRRPTPQGSAVVSEHPLATQVGLEVLQRGGNAADAAVATALALAVVLPRAGNLGGGGFALWADHEGAAEFLDFRETAPRAAKPELYLDASGAFVPERGNRGPSAVGVPGSPAGLYLLWERRGSGRFSFEELAAPAVRLAREGFAVDEDLARDLAASSTVDKLNAAAKAVWWPEGRAPKAGEWIRQADLASTLERYADQGPQGFYAGETRRLLQQELARTPFYASERGGVPPDGRAWLANEDLESYAPALRAPLIGWYRGHQILTAPPPSAGGYVLLHTLGVLEGFPPPGPSPEALYWHRFLEAVRTAYAERALHFGDPRDTVVPLTELLAPARIAQRRLEIGPRAQPAVTATEWTEGDQTTHVCVLDADGAAVSLTTTLNTSFGSGLLVAGAGFFLNDELDDFALRAGAPNTYGLTGSRANAIVPGRRPVSSMTPTIVRDGGHSNMLVLGAPGGPRIPVAVTQVLLRVLECGQTASDAVAAPRLHQQHAPTYSLYERGFDAQVLEQLRGAYGHELQEAKSYLALTGLIHVPTPGARPQAAHDPRRVGAALVTGSVE